MENHPTPPPSTDPDEIDLIALAKQLWLSRTIIFQTVAVSAVLGVTIALFSPKEYTATSTIVPQLGGDANSKLGGLGGLAALAGINLDMQQQGSDLSPIVYPQIVSSIPFQLELMNTPLNFEDFPQPVTLFDYLINLKKPTIVETIGKYSVGLPGLLIDAIKSKRKDAILLSNNTLRPISLTEDQIKVQEFLNEKVTLNVKAKEGYLTITVKLSEPATTAQMALRAQNLLQKYIIDYKTQKSQANLDFIEASYIRSKMEFEQAQVKLAIATDRSNSFINGLAKVETDRLQSQYTITFGVYQELAKQFEQAKIQVKKETPVFTVVDPPVVPFEKTKPKRSIIVIVWIFLGGIAGIGIVLGRQYKEQLYTRWKEV